MTTKTDPGAYGRDVVLGDDMGSPRGLYVGVSGDVSMIHREGEPAITYTNMAEGQIYPLEFSSIAVTGTTATNLVALY